VLDLADIGSEPLVEELGFEQELAKRLVESADRQAKIIAAEKKNKAEDLMEKEVKKKETE
jgi:hypothetical protein